MSDNTVEITDQNFESEVLKSTSPVIVDFWAPWCGPCRAVAPALDELALQYKGQLKIGKYNVDDHTRYAVEHGIRGIPALLFFKDGQIVDRVTGALPKAKIEEKIKPLV